MHDEGRKEREAGFFDRELSDKARTGLYSTYYRVARSSRQHYRQYLENHCEGAEVLEYGCGVSNYASFLADRGARSVVGIDISPVRIQRATERLQDDGHNSVSYRVMDAENMDFDDDSFDLVCGGGILHHLDLARAYRELSRVLRPSGSAIFVEPLGHNPLINRFRNRTPELRTPDEHPLLMADLRSAEECFGTVRARFFHLTGLVAVPFRDFSGFPRIVAALDAFDRALFRLVPPSRKHAWQVAIELSHPGSGRAATPAG